MKVNVKGANENFQKVLENKAELSNEFFVWGDEPNMVFLSPKFKSQIVTIFVKNEKGIEERTAWIKRAHAVSPWEDLEGELKRAQSPVEVSLFLKKDYLLFDTLDEAIAEAKRQNTGKGCGFDN